METLMTIKEVAETVKLTVAGVRKLILKKGIPYFKVGAAIRFRPSEIEEWIEKRRETLILKANRKPLRGGKYETQ